MSINNPFPGMDPWLERHWGDIHQRVVTYACDQLQQNLPRDLRARMQERVFVEFPEGPRRVAYPDVRVLERSRAEVSQTAVAIMEVPGTVVVQIDDDLVTEGYVEIVEAGSGHRVVTVIEVLSRANKAAGHGQDLYRQKQRECREAKVNLVEIDLLRGGRRVMIARQESIPPESRTAYQACVWRGTRPFLAEVYPIPLRLPLAPIQVPLRPTDADVVLDLQSIMNQAYRNGGYDDIDYKLPPDPPLEPEDAAWADQLLRDRPLK